MDAEVGPGGMLAIIGAGAVIAAADAAGMPLSVPMPFQNKIVLLEDTRVAGTTHIQGIDAVVHTARLSDGSRKVIAISEVLPLKNGEYQTRDLIKWQTESIDAEGKIHGRFVLKEKPTFAEQAAMLGMPLPAF